MRPNLIQMLKDDLDEINSTAGKKAMRLTWLRFLIETLHERAFTDIAIPERRTSRGEYKTIEVDIDGELRSYAYHDRVMAERFKPFWWSRTDEELYDLRDYLAPYYKRSENRGQAI